jgi:hypothetical protein
MDDSFGGMTATDILPDFEGYSSDAQFYEREDNPTEAQYCRDLRWEEWDSAIRDLFPE